MDAQTKRRIRNRQMEHATTLARRSVSRWARGRRAAVARAYGVSPSRLTHQATDDVHPVLRDAFRLLLDVQAVDESTARAFARAIQDAVELRPLMYATTATLQARRDFLRDREHDLEAAENRAALHGGPGYRVALRQEAEAQLEIALIEDELDARGAV